MTTKFTRFKTLPPEIRNLIWQFALTQSWSFVKPTRVKQCIKLRGTMHRNIGKSCREARAVMTRTHTFIDTLGWIDFGRSVFFFRDEAFSKHLMRQLEDRHGLITQIQHLLIYPRDWSQVFDTVRLAKSLCTSLRTLVVVAPWIRPPPPLASFEQLDIAPYEDWSPIITSPNQFDYLTLTKTIEENKSEFIIHEYRVELEDAVSQLPAYLYMDIMDNTWLRMLDTLNSLESVVKSFPNSPPTLHLLNKIDLALSERPKRTSNRTSGRGIL